MERRGFNKKLRPGSVENSLRKICLILDHSTIIDQPVGAIVLDKIEVFVPKVGYRPSERREESTLFATFEWTVTLSRTLGLSRKLVPLRAVLTVAAELERLTSSKGMALDFCDLSKYGKSD